MISRLLLNLRGLDEGERSESTWISTIRFGITPVDEDVDAEMSAPANGDWSLDNRL